MRIDVDECDEDIHDCPSDATCENMVGNYTCNCLDDEATFNGTDCMCKTLL